MHSLSPSYEPEKDENVNQDKKEGYSIYSGYIGYLDEGNIEVLRVAERGPRETGKKKGA